MSNQLPHTSEPWQPYETAVLDETRKTLAQCFTIDGAAKGKANARRIVLAVNYAAGLADEELDGLSAKRALDSAWQAGYEAGLRAAEAAAAEQDDRDAHGGYAYEAGAPIEDDLLKTRWLYFSFDRPLNDGEQLIPVNLVDALDIKDGDPILLMDGTKVGTYRYAVALKDAAEMRAAMADAEGNADAT